MPNFKDLKIAIIIKIIIVALLILYVKYNRSKVTINQVDLHLTK